MFLSRSVPSSLFARHDPLLPARTILHRTYANSKSKRHKRKPRVSKTPGPVRQQKHLEHNYREDMFLHRREHLNAINAERRNRREDYELGPLKPWREAVVARPSSGADASGEVKATADVFDEASERYGTMSIRHLQGLPVVPKHMRIKNWFIRVGDRVCLVEGREGERGKIGRVEHVDKIRELVTIHRVNLVDFRRPSYMVGPGESHIQTAEYPVSFRAVRLVYPIQDPVTGIYRDCIINHLEARNRRRDPFRSFDPEEQWTFDRYLMPQNVRIPWPEEPDPQEADRKYDTKREQVEEETFVPTLLRPPMPESVCTELQDSDRGFKGELNALAPGHVNPIKEKRAQRIAAKEAKRQMKPHGATNLARGMRSANADGDFMASKKLPRFDQETLQTIARQMDAARRTGIVGAEGAVVPPPLPPSGSGERASP